MILPKTALCVLGLGIALAGCQKKEPGAVAAAPAATPPTAVTPPGIGLVPSPELSRHFAAVNRQLELGGTLYAYMDVDGDVLKVAAQAHNLFAQVARTQPAIAGWANQDFGALARILGLTDIVAVGASSVAETDGYYRNRGFAYIPGGRHGLLAGFGGGPAPFVHTDLAPANADLYAEAEVDLPAMYKTFREVAAQAGGPPAANQMEDAVKKAGEAAALSFLGVLQNLKGHTALVARLAPDRPISLGENAGAFRIPEISLLICIDGIGAVLEPALQKSPALRLVPGKAHVYEMAHPLPVTGIAPVLVVDGTTLYLATTRAFFDECLARQNPLGSRAEFKQALARVGQEGNGLSYINPAAFQHLRAFSSLNPQLPPDAKRMIDSVLANLPAPDRALVSIRTNLPDGILVRSYADRSLKQDLVALAIYNPVSIGLISAMAVPAFQKVRRASQEKAIQENLRALANAAVQFRAQHPGRAPAYGDLVGAGKYIPALPHVAGENYGLLRFEPGAPLRVRLADGTFVEFRSEMPARR